MDVNIAAALPAIESWGPWAYAAFFFVSVIESMPVLGTAVPGATIVAIIGFAASQGMFALGPCFWLIGLGATVGDFGGYYLGGKSRGAFSAEARFLNERHLARAQAFFAKHGSWSILLGRFFSPLRATVPFVAGTSRMPVAPFIFWNVVSALLWSAAWLALGWVSGGAITSLSQVARAIF